MMRSLIAREVRRGLHGAAWLPVAFFLLVATIVPFKRLALESAVKFGIATGIATAAAVGLRYTVFKGVK